jgi:hypothetical protein
MKEEKEKHLEPLCQGLGVGSDEWADVMAHHCNTTMQLATLLPVTEKLRDTYFLSIARLPGTFKQ